MLISPLIFGLAFAAAGFAFVGGFWLFKYFKKSRLKKDLDMQLLLVRLPVGGVEGEGKKEPLSEVAYTGQLLSVLARKDAPFVLEVAVHNVGEEISFYVAVPRGFSEFAMRQIEGLWGDAQVEVAADDYTVFNPSGEVAAAFLRLKTNFSLPIRSYVDAQLDTFAPILSNFSKINSVGEGLALQVVVSPPPDDAKKTIVSNIQALRQGKKLSDLFQSGIIKLLLPEKKEQKKEGEELKPNIVDEDSVKALEQKVAKPLFNVNVRLVASGPTAFRANELLENLAGSFSQFLAPLRNEFKIIKIRDAKKGLMSFIFREFDEKEAMVLNSDEVISLFHFPISSTDIPRIKFAKARESAPPPNLPISGTLVGESIFRGEARPVYITDDDRRRHLYVIGQTGTGKSGLLQNMAIADVLAGKGVAVVDPHGDLIDAVLANIPESRYQDVIVFDPSDRLYPLGLNMLEYDQNYPEQKTFIVNEMLNIFDRLYDLKTTGGPMFEQYMRNALLLLMEDAENEPATLMEVPRVFTDADFRERKLERIKNPVVVDFWEKEATKAGGDAALANITPYVTSKFGNFIANDYMRPIIAQTKSAFNFRKVMDEGKILLVNLSKGRIGDINANLLGMVVVGKLLMAALSRVDIPQEKRRDFNLFIDEFQNFTTDSISTILSEARKYRLNLVVAHQFIAQLQEKIRDSVFGNVGSMAVFRVGAEDAEFLGKQFEPIFTKNDLLNLDNRHAYVKLLIAGTTARPFNMRTMQFSVGEPLKRDALKEYSRKTYGIERNVVEAETLKRLRE